MGGCTWVFRIRNGFDRIAFEMYDITAETSVLFKWQISLMAC
jgi:hypothetical protein